MWASADTSSRRHFPKTGLAKARGVAKTLPEDRSGEDTLRCEDTWRREDTWAQPCSPGSVGQCASGSRLRIDIPEGGRSIGIPIIYCTRNALQNYNSASRYLYNNQLAPVRTRAREPMSTEDSCVPHPSLMGVANTRGVTKTRVSTKTVASLPHVASSSHVASQDGVRTWRHNAMQRHEDTWRHQVASGRGVTGSCGVGEPHGVTERGVGEWHHLGLKLAPLPGVTGQGRKNVSQEKVPLATSEVICRHRTWRQNVASKTHTASWPHVSSTTWRHERAVKCRGPTWRHGTWRQYVASGARGSRVFKTCLQPLVERATALL